MEKCGWKIVLSKEVILSTSLSQEQHASKLYNALKDPYITPLIETVGLSKPLLSRTVTIIMILIVTFSVVF